MAHAKAQSRKGQTKKRAKKIPFLFFLVFAFFASSR